MTVVLLDVGPGGWKTNGSFVIVVGFKGTGVDVEELSFGG